MKKLLIITLCIGSIIGGIQRAMASNICHSDHQIYKEAIHVNEALANDVLSIALNDGCDTGEW